MAHGPSEEAPQAALVALLEIALLALLRVDHHQLTHRAQDSGRRVRVRENRPKTQGGEVVTVAADWARSLIVRAGLNQAEKQGRAHQMGEIQEADDRLPRGAVLLGAVFQGR